MSDGNRASVRDRWRYNLLRMRYTEGSNAAKHRLTQLHFLLLAARWQKLDVWKIWEEDFWTENEME